jgi:hypothetical protein
LAQYFTPWNTWTIILLAVLSGVTHLTDKEARVAFQRGVEIKVPVGFLMSPGPFSSIYETDTVFTTKQDLRFDFKVR